MDTGAAQSFPQQLLIEIFSELGATGSIVRTILLRDRYFAGYRFRCAGLQAIQLAGEDVVKFYDQEQTLLKTVNVNPAEGKKAA